jgi:hypothetical protein
MRGCKALLEQQAHRIALIAEGRLHADEDLPKRSPSTWMCAPSVCWRPGGAPLRLDLRQVGLAPDVIVGMDAVVHIGHRAEAGGVAVDDALAQAVDQAGTPPCSPRGPGRQRVQGLEHRQVAADPVAPELGGKLKITAATRRSARSRGAQVDSLPTRAASVGPLDAAVHVARDHVLEAAAVAAAGAGDVGAVARPPNTIAPVAPSSSGMATIIVASTGSRPRGAAPLVERLELHRVHRE